MTIKLSLANKPTQQGEVLVAELTALIEQNMAAYCDDFVQDMSHISQAAVYEGNMAVEQILYLKDNLYRCDYSYDWAIGWTCSGTQEAGRVTEKVRFTVADNGELDFKFLTLEG